MPAADAGALREFGPETKLRVQVHRADDVAAGIDDALDETWHWGNRVIFFIGWSRERLVRRCRSFVF